MLRLVRTGSLAGQRRACQPERFLSSAAATASSSTAPRTTNNVIARTLYRQLLKWCRVVQPSGVPLSPYIPPIHIQVAEHAEHVLQKLSGDAPTYTVDDQHLIQQVRPLLPTKTYYTQSSMTVPIHSASQLHGFFQALFRLNASDSLRLESPKQAITNAFDALKSLNALNDVLDQVQRRRQIHANHRDDIHYRIGQVVRHKRDRWRGVIVGWERSSEANDDDSSNNKTKTSLTDKDYSDVMEAVQYDVLVDEGDAHVRGILHDEPCRVVPSELEVVDDDALARIRHDAVPDYFKSFDKELLMFVPKSQLAYEYPADVAPVSSKSVDDMDNGAAISHTITEATQQFAARLERLILEETSCPEDQRLSILANVQARLTAIATGDVFPDMSHQFSDTDPSSSSIAAMHIKALFDLSLEIQNVMFRRRQSQEHQDVFEFQVGDIVLHQKYGFRGVVIACDPTPAFDVSRWDGLDHVDNPQELPFYHVIPDQADCIEAFGGERPMRYVCQANLLNCPDHRLDINVDLHSGWTKTSSGRSYLAPADHRFKHGLDAGDDGITERCIGRLEEEIYSWQVKARQGQQLDEPMRDKLSMSNIMTLLKEVDSAADAAPIQEMLKEMRKAHPSAKLRQMLQQGMNSLLNGNVSQALDDFQQIVAADPEYAEAHNKVATCLFMVGRFEEAMAATNRTLALDPYHFQALNGMGLIHFERGDYQQAVESFRKSVSFDPWSPVSAKLAVAVDRSHQETMTDDGDSIDERSS